VNRASAAWDHLLAACAGLFTKPSFALFCELLGAWALCPGRHTVTRMLEVLGPSRRRAHDSYHRFLRAARWSTAELWRLLALRLVARFAVDGAIPLDLDDTLFHKSGRKVEGAGSFRDAVRSTGKRVVYALGLNLVVLTLRVRPPWGAEPLGLPINLRLYRKGGLTHLDLAEAMVRDVADWLPDRRFSLCADGAYASLAGRGLPRTHFTSRMRRDAALYDLPKPRRKGQRGRPAKKGKRLPTPTEIARRARSKEWKRVKVDVRGSIEWRLVLCLNVLWYKVCREQQVLLVIVRDPEGKQPDDFFFTTDLGASGARVAGDYAGRWSIEDTFRNVKQYLGGEHPQAWKGQGPERAAMLSLWLYAATWEWYITTQGTKMTWPCLAWYASKRTASFADALAALRRVLWRERLFGRSGLRALTPKSANTLIDVLARAA
jgi:hypothetical protein